MKQKRCCWLLSIVTMIFFLLPMSVNAVEAVPDVSGNAWDDYVMNHEQEFEEKVQSEKANFSAQEIQMTEGSSETNEQPNLRNGNIKARYTVLVVDISGSMEGLPMKTAKEATDKFVQQMISAQGENYVSLVTFSGEANVLCEFTNKLDELQQAVKKMNVYWSGTNTDTGLAKAGQLLEKIENENTTKNIVVLSDGEPQDGDAAITTADKLKKQDYFIYSLGFFHNLSGSSLTRARTFMDRLQNAGYYDVTSSDELEFEFDKIADDITSRSNIFKYPSSDEKLKNSDASAVYYYKDSYFKQSAYEYNEQLATMSLSLALSAFGSTDVGSDYQNKSNNAKNLLKEIGFTDVKTNDWFTKKPEKDSVGAIAGKKKIKENGKEYTLIALAVRGDGYESEWASNFTLGKTDYHQGFSEARDQVLQFLTKEYIAANGISGDIKLWITGFSRAAATANLVAGKIDEGVSISNCTLDLDDMYAYTFETPAGMPKSKADENKCKNIFNIINKSDPVPRVAPKDWGFERYGKDRVLPAQEITSEKEYKLFVKNMQQRFISLAPNTNYLVDDFAMKKIDWSAIFPGGKPFVFNATQSVFLDDFVNVIANESFKNRSNYVKHYETAIRNTVGSIYGTDDSKTWEVISKKLTELIIYERWTEFKSLFVPEFLEGWLKKISTEEGVPYEKENLKPLTSIINSLKNHPVMLYALVTQKESLAQAHYPELCLAWLQSQDSNYTEGGKASFVSGNYRIIRINCPVDVEVYNDENQLVAAIVNDEPQELTSLVSSINENGEKLIYLPPDADYSVKLTATDNGKMSYAVNEYSYEAGEITRIRNYYDLPLQKGKAYTGQVPAYTNEELENGTENGTNVSYTLVDEHTKQEIIPAAELAGEEAAAEYQITAESADEGEGIVFGGGLYKVGNFVQLTAVPNEGYEFVGWYQDEKQVSTEVNYRFRVEAEKHLIAKFKPKKGQGADAYNLLHGKFDPEKNVIKADDWQTFIDAYRDETVTKIVLTKNIEDSSPSRAKGPTSYKRKKSIEIDGQGHRLTLKKYHSLRTSEAPDSYQEVVDEQTVGRSMFHLHDISLRQNMSGKAACFGQYSSNAFVGALDTHSSWYKEVSSREEDLTKNWYFRFGNIDTKEDNNTTNANGLARLVMAYGAEVTLYGSLDLSTTSENMYVGSLIVEDGTSWKGSAEYYNLSLVWFIRGDQKQGTGRSEELTIGKNCQIALKNSVKGKNYPAFYGHYKQAVIDEKSIVVLETNGNAWRFDQSGSSLTIKKDAELNLISNGNGKVLQFGRGPLNPTKISDCQLKVEPGGSLFVKGAADRAGGISAVDFTGGNYFTSNTSYEATNCMIELDQPKAYDFSNTNDSKRIARQSVLNLRNNTNKFVIRNSDVAIWKTGRSLAESEQQQPDQRMTKIERFELVGKQGSNHSQEVQGLPNYQELFGKDMRRISNK
ncbi:VWA domain-containing protein [Erwinia sp. CPCC 100877]|nr:VWA domain-containing protein [Erwinia sp. CPCC 100877]